MSRPDVSREQQVAAQEEAVDVEAPLVHRVAGLRDEATLLNHDVAATHDEVREFDLDRATTLKALNGPEALLHELAVQHGVGWSTLAKLLGVSVVAVRKWRRGASVSPENLRNLARLTAFLEHLKGVHPLVADPVSWLEMPISDDSSVTGADVYGRGGCLWLLDLAGDRLSPRDVLDRYDPGWVNTTAPDHSYEIVEMEDGTTSIAPAQDV